MDRIVDLRLVHSSACERICWLGSQQKWCGQSGFRPASWCRGNSKNSLLTLGCFPTSPPLATRPPSIFG